MKLTKEESQALTFIAAMILISAGARVLGRPGPVEIHGEEVSIAELERGSLALMEPGRAASTAASLGWVNVNTATEAEIAAIPKVGAAIAALVVARRGQQGSLDLDALRELPGMKKAALEALADHASFGTWDDPERLTPPPGRVALEQEPRRTPPRRTGTTSRSTPPTRPPAPVIVRRGGTRTAGEAASGPIAINEASSEELMRLPGVGETLAGRIIAHRQQHGPFRRLEDLDAVSGIGPALLEKLAPLIRF